MSKNYIGQGTTLGYKAAGGMTYTLVGLLETVTPPDVEYQSADASVLASTFMVKRPTVIDPGEFEFTVQFDYEDASHLAMKTMLLTPGQLGTTNWQITEPDGTTVTFTGFLTKFAEDEIEFDQICMADGAVTLTSIPVYVAGTAG